MSRTSVPRPDHYGTPVKGSKTERRAKQAHQRISGEILQLCEIIHAEGQDNGRGSRDIAFGELFSIYVVVSNKLVGVLLRARKHGIVDFEGETLFQGRDDKTVVTLNKDPAEVRRLQRRQEEVDGGGEGGEFQWGKCLKTE